MDSRFVSRQLTFSAASGKTVHVVRDGRVDGQILNPEEAAWLQACSSAAVPTAPEKGERPSREVMSSSPGPPAGAAAACVTPHPVYAGYPPHEPDVSGLR